MKSPFFNNIGKVSFSNLSAPDEIASKYSELGIDGSSDIMKRNIYTECIDVKINSLLYINLLFINTSY